MRAVSAHESMRPTWAGGPTRGTTWHCSRQRPSGARRRLRPRPGGRDRGAYRRPLGGRSAPGSACGDRRRRRRPATSISATPRSVTPPGSESSLETHRRARREGRRLVLASITPRTGRLLRAARLHRVFHRVAADGPPLWRLSPPEDLPERVTRRYRPAVCRTTSPPRARRRLRHGESPTGRGSCARMPATPAPPPATRSTGPTWPRGRPACRSPSTCRRRPATTPTIVLARGEVGKVGVPVSHIGDMRALFDGIPLAEMNTSMTINATAMWLLALYQVVAEEQGASRGVAWPARPRTTSSRSTSRAGPTSSRPVPRCG